MGEGGRRENKRENEEGGMEGEAGVEIYVYDDPAGHFGKANVGLIFRGSTSTFYYILHP